MSSVDVINWKTVRLESVLLERKERALNDGIIPLYSLTIQDGVSPKSERYKREFLVKNTDKKTYKTVLQDDLVFNPANLRWGAIARSRTLFPVLVSPIYEVLYPQNTNELDPIFLEYLAKSDEMHLQYLHYMEGTLVERTALKIDNFLKLQINLPPLPEQKKIASILTSVDEVIESTQKQIDKLQDLKKATMNELLTKGIGHTEFKDSELGRIPKSWEVLTFSESDIKVLDGDRGNEYPKEADLRNSGFCLFLSAKNVTKNGFRFDTTTFITKDKDERLGKGKLNPQDIVITTRGTVGNIAFYDDSVNFNTVRINSGMAIIRNNNAHIECKFIYKLLSSGVITTQLKNLTFGSAQPQLTIGTLNELRLPIPPLAEQSQIVSAITSIQIALDKIENKLSQTQSLKKSLMQDLLTGKVRVSVN